MKKLNLMTLSGCQHRAWPLFSALLDTVCQIVIAKGFLVPFHRMEKALAEGFQYGSLGQ